MWTSHELAQLPLRVKETRAHSALGRADDDADLGARALFDLGNDHDHTLLERELVEREEQTVRELGPGEVALRIAARGLGLAGQTRERRAAARAGADVVLRVVHGHRDEERAERRIA